MPACFSAARKGSVSARGKGAVWAGRSANRSASISQRPISPAFRARSRTGASARPRASTTSALSPEMVRTMRPDGSGIIRWMAVSSSAAFGGISNRGALSRSAGQRLSTSAAAASPAAITGLPGRCQSRRSKRNGRRRGASGGAMRLAMAAAISPVATKTPIWAKAGSPAPIMARKAMAVVPAPIRTSRAAWRRSSWLARWSG